MLSDLDSQLMRERDDEFNYVSISNTQVLELIEYCFNTDIKNIFDS